MEKARILLAVCLIIRYLEKYLVVNMPRHLMEKKAINDDLGKQPWQRKIERMSN